MDVQRLESERARESNMTLHHTHHQSPMWPRGFTALARQRNRQKNESEVWVCTCFPVDDGVSSWIVSRTIESALPVR